MDTRNSGLRLSRLRYPRATLWAMLLLVLVFLGFGLVAGAHVPATEPAVTVFEELGAGVSALPAILLPGNWCTAS